MQKTAPGKVLATGSAGTCQNGRIRAREDRSGRPWGRSRRGMQREAEGDGGSSSFCRKNAKQSFRVERGEGGQNKEGPDWCCSPVEEE